MVRHQVLYPMKQVSWGPRCPGIRGEDRLGLQGRSRDGDEAGPTEFSAENYRWVESWIRTS